MTDLRKTAVYIRLSAEDANVDGRANKESDRVTSQRNLLKSFAGESQARSRYTFFASVA